MFWLAGGRWCLFSGFCGFGFLNWIPWGRAHVFLSASSCFWHWEIHVPLFSNTHGLSSITNLQYRNHNHLRGRQQAWDSPISCHSQGTCRAGEQSETSGGRTVEKWGIPDHMAGYLVFRRSEVTERYLLGVFLFGFFVWFLRTHTPFFKGGKGLFSICQHFHLFHAIQTAVETDYGCTIWHTKSSITETPFPGDTNHSFKDTRLPRPIPQQMSPSFCQKSLADILLMSSI